MKKKWLSCIAALILLVSCSVVAAAATDNPVKLMVNGREIKANVLSQLINDRTMVPVRWVAQALEARCGGTAERFNIDSTSLSSTKQSRYNKWPDRLSVVKMTSGPPIGTGSMAVWIQVNTEL